jgi:hypothetical protein
MTKKSTGEEKPTNSQESQKGVKEKVIVKRNELFNMQAAIGKMNGIMSSDLGAKRAKIRRLIEQDIEDMQDFTKTDEWKRISNLYTKIDEQCAKLDASGNPLRNNQGGYIIANSKTTKRDELISELKSTEHEAIEDRERVWKEFSESLDKTEVDITGYPRIPFELFKKDVPTEVIDWLWPLIDEDK